MTRELKNFDTQLDLLAFQDLEGCDMFDLHERKEDMSPDGRLQVIIQPDGDGIIGIIPPSEDHFGNPSVEFCTPFMGGGSSPRVLKAIRILLKAIYLDNGGVTG